MLKKIFDKDFIMLDGAMGTMLQQSGLKPGELPEILNITNPSVVIDIHKKYIEAGSDIIYANTFGANKHKYQNAEYSVKEVIEAGIKNAKEACFGTSALAALDIGPIGRMLKPIGDMDFDEAYEIFAEEVDAAKDADLIVIETMTSLMETKAALLAAKERSDKPVICTLTFEETGRTFTGCGIPNMALTLEALGADALGFNCSLGPKELLPFVKELSEYTNLPLVLKANAGLPDPETNTYNISAKEFAKLCLPAKEYGVVYFGGCCGTTPEFIKELKNALLADSNNPPKERDYELIKKNRTAVCSGNSYVRIDEPRVIGERINPTGKKLFKQALLDHDLDYILKQGIDQADAGADILDVNVGLPGIDEVSMMAEVVTNLQGLCDCPLQLDSTDPLVLERALRVYEGVPIINSVNGEEESLKNILPLAKKYGTMLICLTLDEDGIPKTKEKRIEIAEKIINRAKEYGIPEEKLVVDCLTLTASAEQAGVMGTVLAIEDIKKKYNVKAALGVSNVSFGLPNRELINRTFLAIALEKGLDLAIINPNNLAMMETFKAYKVVANIDENSVDYIEFEALHPSKTVDANAVVTGGGTNSSVKSKDTGSIEDADPHVALDVAIGKGLKEKCGELTKKLLETEDSMDIIDKVLVPALDKIGTRFEKGEIFLPQLIMSANSASACFEVIKKTLSSSGEKVNKGTIVIATVKGDVHDIGKNIVKVLLENYGFNVIDLGKDVPPEAVLEATIKSKAKLVGLSALMTTTLKAMEDTINLLKENHVDCRTFVGGAVLTADYAKKIGADFYTKDANASVEVAKKVYSVN